MAFNYNSMLVSTVRQIEKYGRDVTYRAYNSGKYDPATGTVSANGETETTVRAVVTSARVYKTDDSALQRGDKFFLIAADEVTPDKRDAIIDGSETYKIIDIIEIKPGDTALAYKLQARK